MITLELHTFIAASPEAVFDASRSIDMHLHSLQHTRERAVAGRTTGLLNLGETVTWEARHFGFSLQMTVRMAQLQAPNYFCDEQVRGPFAFMRHEHFFDAVNGGTQMRDRFCFAAPLGVLGRLAEVLVLRRYMRRLLQRRNEALQLQFSAAKL